LSIPSSATLPLLPLLLWKTPPGLELILAQEGISYAHIRELHPWSFQGGRFVLFDGRRSRLDRIRPFLSPDHVPIDIDVLRRDSRIDPLAAVLETRGARQRCFAAGTIVHERISRIDQGFLREQLLQALRNLVDRHGGTWVRLARYPYPYRSAFNFRADLDEPYPRDFRRFARASLAIADCTTLFVSTRAYGRDTAILRELAEYDTQSHGHNHVVYRDEQTNLRNLRRAHDVLVDHGLAPTAFAAPEGRWNAGLDRVVESLEYEYSSEFQLSYDDLPFFPWRDRRFSNVLQIPVHPICEGLFLDTGATDLTAFAVHLRLVARAKIEAGEPVFLYGHPERRLGRHPKTLDALIHEIAGEPLLWRVTLTAFARWWRWRSLRKWSLLAKSPELLEVQFEDWDAAHPLALEVVRGEHSAAIPIATSRTMIRFDQLAFEKRRPSSDRLQVLQIAPDGGFKQVVKQMLDWETVTPVEELPSRTLREQLKRKLRHWRSRTGQSLTESAR
jgi:hypothetical protein